MSKVEIIKVAQIGCGYWGPNLLRNFSSIPGCKVKYVVEREASRRRFVETNYHETKATDNLEEVLEDPEVRGVVIATPPKTHFEIARRALKAGKHILVEKPLTMNVRDADTLAELAKPHRLRIMAGHTFLYHPAVDYLKALVKSGEIGRLYFIYTQRLNLGVVRPDVNALWNLAPHDVSILCHLLDQWPESVEATGTAFLQPGIEDIVFMSLRFAGDFHANIHVSWLDPHKTRKVTLVGEKKMVVYDDVADDKIRIYDLSVNPRRKETPFDRIIPFNLGYSAGEITVPQLVFKEPLLVEAEHFLHCIRTGEEPLTGYQHARGVIDVLEKAQASIDRSKSPPSSAA